MKKAVLVCLAILLCLPLFSCQGGERELVTIDILSIGKADCIVIQTRENVVMIDTGEEENIPEIAAFLQEKGIRSLDVLILSHFDKDHIGGAPYLIEHYDVKEVFQSSFSSDRKEFFAYHDALAKKGQAPHVLTGDLTFSEGDCHFAISVPKKSSYERKEDNNTSLIVTLSYGRQQYLFCGDAMEERLEEFLSENTAQYSFVKLPYHGKNLENLSAFLNSVQPRDAAVTASRKNPADERTLSLLKERGIRVFDTKDGAIHLSLTPENFKISQIKK